jgi:hypothetical protein
MNAAVEHDRLALEPNDVTTAADLAARAKRCELQVVAIIRIHLSALALLPDLGCDRHFASLAVDKNAKNVVD